MGWLGAIQLGESASLRKEQVYLLKAIARKEGTSDDFWENHGIASVVLSWVWREEACPGWDRLL